MHAQHADSEIRPKYMLIKNIFTLTKLFLIMYSH